MPQLKRTYHVGGTYGRPYKKARTAPAKPAPYRTRNNTELKYLDTNTLNTTISPSGTIVDPSLNLILQGTSDQDRIGRRVIIKNVLIRATFKNITSKAYDNLRLIVYHDKQTNKDKPLVSDIVTDASYYAFNNLNNKERFRILADHYVDVSSGTVNSLGPPAVYSEDSKSFQIYKQCEIPIEYAGTVGDITDLTSGNIGVLAFAKEGGILDMRTRVRFLD